MTTDVIKDVLGADITASKTKTYVVSAANNQGGVDVHVMSQKSLNHFKGDVVEALEVDAAQAEDIADKLRAANTNTCTPAP